MATLYRKYRSQRFEDVIGQDPIITTLTNQIKLGRIGHAYLFTGSRGIGKTSCARIFARAVNCLHPVNGSPCGECEVCKKLAADNVDIIEMDAASNNGVDDARDIREKVKYLPVACKYKVYIIDEVHMLTGGAFNALLKTIEEPPDHVIFILATTEPQKLPQTILSRCIRFDFKLVPTDILAKHVARVYDAEGIKYTPDAVEEIARLGEGSVRDALSVADTIASAADLITSDIVLKLTGAGDSGAIAALFDATAERDLKVALECVDGFAKSGKSINAVCRQLIDYTRNVLVCKSVGPAAASGLINADRATLDRIAAAAAKCAMPDISYMLVELGSAEAGLKYSINPRVYLETTLVKLICVADENAELLKRISALENSANPAEQKKNNQVKAASTDNRPAAPRDDREKTVTPAKSAAAFASDKSVKAAPCPAKEYAFDEPSPPPPDDCPPPPDDYSFAAPSEKPIAKKSGDKSFGAGKPTQVDRADEGEFWHLQATREDGLELLGKISRAVRRKQSPAALRARRLLARDVMAKERDEYIAFVAPEDAFLPLGEPTVMQVLNEVLDELGIAKRAKIERTEDDLYADDLKRAYELFGRDGVVPKVTA